MRDYHVLSVFRGPGGTGGNPLGVFLEGDTIPADERQAIATKLGFSETVFVENLDDGRVQIFTPVQEVPYAGHPLVGTAWLLRQSNPSLDTLRPRIGNVPCWEENSMSFIRLSALWSLGWQLNQLGSPDEIDALEPDTSGWNDYWAWIDEAAGTIRSRVFVPDVGVAEDEATGSAAGELTAKLGRPIEIHQGIGSVIIGRPGPNNTVEIGGEVSLLSTETL